ncbi:MAG: tape measure protein, partial [Oscillatoria sp. SIO1A7]|nr:tape measure protein [Oscillatoria sp. SIO1A7]
DVNADNAVIIPNIKPSLDGHEISNYIDNNTEEAQQKMSKAVNNMSDLARKELQGSANTSKSNTNIEKQPQKLVFSTKIINSADPNLEKYLTNVYRNKSSKTNKAVRRVIKNSFDGMADVLDEGLLDAAKVPWWKQASTNLGQFWKKQITTVSNSAKGAAEFAKQMAASAKLTPAVGGVALTAAGIAGVAGAVPGGALGGLGIGAAGLATISGVGSDAVQKLVRDKLGDKIADALYSNPFEQAKKVPEIPKTFVRKAFEFGDSVKAGIRESGGVKPYIALEAQKAAGKLSAQFQQSVRNRVLNPVRKKAIEGIKKLRATAYDKGFGKQFDNATRSLRQELKNFSTDLRLFALAPKEYLKTLRPLPKPQKVIGKIKRTTSNFAKQAVKWAGNTVENQTAETIKWLGREGKKLKQNPLSYLEGVEKKLVGGVKSFNQNWKNMREASAKRQEQQFYKASSQFVVNNIYKPFQGLKEKVFQSLEIDQFGSLKFLALGAGGVLKADGAIDPSIGFSAIAEKLNQLAPGLGDFAGGLKQMFFSLTAGRQFLNLFKNLINSSFQLSIKFNLLETTMRAMVGSSARAAESLNFVKGEAKRLSLDLASSIQSYTLLAGSTKGGELEGAQTKSIFSAISQAATTYGLSTDQINGAILAVSQMAGKGLIALEELRGQLAERLPGAVQIAARSMGVTTEALTTLISSGQLTAQDFLPRFARQLLAETSGATPKTAKAAMQDLENQITEIKLAIARKVGPVIAPAFMAVAGAVKLIHSFIGPLSSALTGLGLAIGANALIAASRLKLIGLALNFLQFQVGKTLATYGPQIALGMAALQVAQSAFKVFNIAMGKNEYSDWADSLSERVRKIEDAFAGVNKEIKQIAAYRPESVGWFDDLLRTDGKTGEQKAAGYGLAAGGAAAGVPLAAGLIKMQAVKFGLASTAAAGLGAKAASIGGLLTGAGLKAAFIGAIGSLTAAIAALGAKIAAIGGLFVGAGAAATSAGVGATGAAVAGAAGAGGVAAAIGGLPIAVVGAIGAAIAVPLGAGINTLITGFRTGEFKFTSLADASKDKEIIAMGEAFDEINKMVGKSLDLRQQMRIGTGPIPQIKELDAKQRELGTKLALARSAGDGERAKQLRLKMSQVQKEKDAIAGPVNDLIDFLTSTEIKLKQQRAGEKDPTKIAALDVQIASVTKNRQGLMSDMQFEGAIESLQNFANAVRDFSANMAAYARIARRAVTEVSISSYGTQFENFGTDRLGAEKGDLERARAQLEATRSQVAAGQKEIAYQKETLAAMPAYPIILDDISKKEKVKGRQLEPEDLKEMAAKAGEQKQANIKNAYNQIAAIKEREDELMQLRQQSVQQAVQLQQSEERFKIQAIQEGFTDRKAAIDKFEAGQIIAIKTKQRDRVLSETKAQERIAALQVKSGARLVEEIERRQREIRQARSRGVIGAKEFANQERAIASELASAKQQLLDREMAARKAAAQAALELMEREQKRLNYQQVEAPRAQGQIQIAKQRIESMQRFGKEAASQMAGLQNSILENSLSGRQASLAQKKLKELEKLKGKLSSKEYEDKRMEAESALASAQKQHLETEIQLREQMLSPLDKKLKQLEKEQKLLQSAIVLEKARQSLSQAGIDAKLNRASEFASTFNSAGFAGGGRQLVGYQRKLQNQKSESELNSMGRQNRMAMQALLKENKAKREQLQASVGAAEETMFAAEKSGNELAIQAAKEKLELTRGELRTENQIARQKQMAMSAEHSAQMTRAKAAADLQAFKGQVQEIAAKYREIELSLDKQQKLLQANQQLEEARNQAGVKRLDSLGSLYDGNSSARAAFERLKAAKQLAALPDQQKLEREASDIESKKSQAKAKQAIQVADAALKRAFKSKDSQLIQSARTQSKAARENAKFQEELAIKSSEALTVKQESVRLELQLSAIVKEAAAKQKEIEVSLNRQKELLQSSQELANARVQSGAKYLDVLSS